MHEEYLGEVPEELMRGDCLECHDDFDEAAEDIPRIKFCAGCHEIFLNYNLLSRPEIRPCIGCHRTAPYDAIASIPDFPVCLSCHQEPLTSSIEEQKLLDHIDNSEEILWVSVYDYLPGDIVFSHERHVMQGKIDCAYCHGRIDEFSEPVSRAVTLKMEDCMDCHESTNAENDCLACHR